MLSLILLASLVRIQAEVRILSQVRYLYDRYPPLLLQVSNIADVNPSDITLSIGAEGQTPLVTPQGITLEKSPLCPECLSVNLNPDMKYVETRIK